MNEIITAVLVAFSGWAIMMTFFSIVGIFLVKSEESSQKTP